MGREMGKGRSPCCDKEQVKRGPWSPEEDMKLITFIQKHGHENWRALPKKSGLMRCGKSCRLRWINYLRPDLKRGNFTREEEDSIIRLHEAMGNKWAKIASQLPGRTDNEIKNVWNTHLKKRSLAMKKNNNPDHVFGDDQSKEVSSISSSSSSSSSSSGNPSSTAEHQSADQEISMAHNKPHESCSLKTLEKLDDDDHHQDSPMELTKFRSDPKHTKELTSSSVSSNGSSLTQVDNTCSRPDDDEPMDLLFDFSEPYDIPLESDYDFWSMLDGFVPCQSNQVQLQQADDVAYNNPSSNLLGQVDTGKWLSYLESELGLVDNNQAAATESTILSKDTSNGQLVPECGDKKPNNPAGFDYDDEGMDYFQVWPSLPPNNSS